MAYEYANYKPIISILSQLKPHASILISGQNETYMYGRRMYIMVLLDDDDKTIKDFKQEGVSFKKEGNMYKLNIMANTKL